MLHELLRRFLENLPAATFADVASLVWALPLVTQHYTS